MRKYAFGLLALAMPTASANAVIGGYCLTPTAPIATFLRKPSKPFCAFDRSCSEWEVENYRSDVEEHFRDLKRYARDVDRFYNDAASFVECMSELE